jgi:hypothetical protein
VDIFSLLLAAGFDLQGPDTVPPAAAPAEAPAAVDAGGLAAERAVGSIWQASLRSIKKQGSLLPILQGIPRESDALEIAAESPDACALLLERLQVARGRARPPLLNTLGARHSPPVL